MLPVSVILFAAGACCCCGGDLAEQLEKEGIKIPGEGGATSGTGARAMSSVPAGESVKIVDIDPEDAYYSDRASIIGKVCVTDEPSSFKDGGWHGGSVHCTSSTDTYYFYKAAYEDLGPAPAGSVIAPPTTTTAAPPPSGPPPAGSATASLPSGARVKILDVAPDDAYFSDKGTIIGKSCTLQEPSSVKDGGWQGGSVNCDGGDSYYFYKAAYQQL